MKRLIVFLLLFFIAFPAWSGPVDADRAKSLARSFFQRDSRKSLRDARIVRVEAASLPTKSAQGTPAFHIFNREGGGFVIIAGDDACRPILGYSFENSFGTGELPDNLRSWLGELEKQVETVRSHGVYPSLETYAAWNSLSVSTKAGSDGFEPAHKLETPLWNQRAPFNDLAPTVDGEKAVAGCVPVAMGMIMRFFGYPSHGEGTLPTYGYSSDTGSNVTVEGFELDHQYDWTKIKYNYLEAYTEEEGAEAARLVYDLGVAVKAKFDKTTSAKTEFMVTCAINYFGFDPGAVFYNRDFFSDAEWISMLKAELQDRPVLYSASREGGGHAFLLDGYDEKDNLSVNWGWGGSSNGYYPLSAFSPSGSQQYLFDHRAVFNFKPIEGSGGDVQEFVFLSGGKTSSGTEYKGLDTQDEILAGKGFNLTVGFVYNGGNQTATWDLVIALVDAEGKIKERISSPWSRELEPRSGIGFPSVPCMMHCFPVEGDRICLLYHKQGWPDDDWRIPVYQKADGMTPEISVRDDRELAAVTSFNYNKTVHEVNLQTKDGVEWELVSSAGQKVTEGVKYELTTLTIKTLDLPKGAYKLTLRRGNESLTLNLKMGEK